MIVKRYLAVSGGGEWLPGSFASLDLDAPEIAISLATLRFAVPGLLADRHPRHR